MGLITVNVENGNWRTPKGALEYRSKLEYELLVTGKERQGCPSTQPRPIYEHHSLGNANFINGDILIERNKRGQIFGNHIRSNRKVTRALITSMFIIGKNTPDIHYYRKVNDYLCSGNLGGQNLTQYNSQIVTQTSKISFRVHQWGYRKFISLHLHIKMKARKVIFRISGRTSVAESCLRGKLIFFLNGIANY